jgi:hypothetical protein
MSTDMPASAPQYQGGPQQGAPQYQNAPQPQQIPPAPKKKGIVARILTAIIGLAVAGGVYYGINYLTSDAAQSKAGDCASVTGPRTSPEFKTVDCGSSEANYTIGKALELNQSCGSDSYEEYTETASRGPDTKLCLVPILVEGTCYDMETATQADYKAVDCGAPGAVKVVKLVKGSDDESVCADSTPFTVPEPKTTFCLAAAENA